MRATAPFLAAIYKHLYCEKKGTIITTTEKSLAAVALTMTTTAMVTRRSSVYNHVHTYKQCYDDKTAGRLSAEYLIHAHSHMHSLVAPINPMSGSASSTALLSFSSVFLSFWFFCFQWGHVKKYARKQVSYRPCELQGSSRMVHSMAEMQLVRNLWLLQNALPQYTGMVCCNQHCRTTTPPTLLVTEKQE